MYNTTDTHNLVNPEDLNSVPETVGIEPQRLHECSCGVVSRGILKRTVIRFPIKTSMTQRRERERERASDVELSGLKPIKSKASESQRLNPRLKPASGVSVSGCRLSENRLRYIRRSRSFYDSTAHADKTCFGLGFTSFDVEDAYGYG